MRQKVFPDGLRLHGRRRRLRHDLPSLLVAQVASDAERHLLLSLLFLIFLLFFLLPNKLAYFSPLA